MFWNKKNILIVLGLVLILTAVVAKADYMFGTPTIISTNYFTAPSVSADGLTCYVDAPDGSGGWEIWVSTRETIHDDWSDWTKPTPPNSAHSDGNPDISADGRMLVFSSDRPGGYGSSDIWLTTRETKDDPWSEPVNLGPAINGLYYDTQPSISNDGRSLYFASTRPGGHGGPGDRDLYVSTRATLNDDWSEAENLGPIVNSSSRDSGPDISNDGLMLFFDSRRPGGYDLDDIYVTTRATTEDDWGVPVNLGPIVNTSNYDQTPCISIDGSFLYLYSNGYVREVPLIPLVDLNGSGFFDIDDLVIIIKNWDTNEPSCDIAPMPWGDGVVDKKDLEIFMSYWGQEVIDPNLIAHWPLDETEGTTTQEKVTDKLDLVFGEPIWQPDGGMVNGALELDGIDDCVITNFDFNPSEGPFSVFAWIKGGLFGETIISQANGANWLSADIVDGTLTTELKGEDITGSILLSQTVITDGDWHRVGLVWDGLNRILYVDDEAVSQDTQANLSSSERDLLIGTGYNMETGFWTGLIDEVRIYNRAITP